MNPSLHLHIEHGPTWFHDKTHTCWARGWLFDEKGTFLTERSLINWLTQATPESLTRVSGHFSLVHLSGKWAATDAVRSLPLLYHHDRTQGFLTDHIDFFPSSISRLIASEHTAYFPLSGHTLGHHTLYKGIFQVPPGTMLKWDEEVFRLRPYTHFSLAPREVEEKVLRSSFRATATTVFERFIQTLGGRPVVVPLSGGYDSRFIVAMLKHLGYEQVRCFTYGKPHTPEVQISQQVAKQLGFAWKMVPYTTDNRTPYLADTGVSYQRFAGNGMSLPHDQDVTAVQVLKASGFFPEDAVFVPGFGGDVLAGSWYQPDLDGLPDRRALMDYLSKQRKFFSGKKNQSRPAFSTTHFIEAELEQLPIPQPYHALSDLQAWGIRNRMSKYLVNAVRVYEWYGYDWRLPFFDQAWVDFWRGVPVSLKHQKYLYLSEAEDWLFRPMGISFAAPTFTPVGWQTRLKRVLPASAVNWLKFQMGDPTAYDYNNDLALAQQILSQMGWPRRYLRDYGLNYLLGKWYVEKVLSR